MEIVFYLALLIYLANCGVLVALILMQEGKGGGLSGVMGASMGETFGFGGASKQIRKYTAICATVFLVMSLIMTFLAERTFFRAASAFIGEDTPAATTAPAPTTTEFAVPGEGEGTAPAPAEGAAPAESAPAEEAAPEAQAESAPAEAPAPAESAPAEDAPALETSPSE